jgi:hypothetical protein
MKKKNLYVLIVIAVIAFIGLILWLLNTSKKEINPEHIKLNFIIYSQTALSEKDDLIKNDYLKPLIESNVIGNADGTENLFIAGLEIKGNKFCIPAQGINYLRYNDKSPLNQSNYTSTTREADELSFFESWEGGEKLEKIIKSIKSDNLKLKLPPISVILNQQKSKFVDSLIICVKCSDQDIKTHEPFVFKSAAELRKFVNKQLEKHPNAIDEKGINNSIKIFIYKDLVGIDSPSPNSDTKKDTDGDGVPDNIDQCPKEKGEIKCSGCPCIIAPCPTGDKDQDGICDEKDNCPNDYGQKKYGGCPPDSDGDGIWDKFDKCPFEKGQKEFQGCPRCINDIDKDGICDEKDQCPSEKGNKINNGCPDKLQATFTKINQENRFTFKIKGAISNNSRIEIVVRNANNSNILDDFILTPQQIKSSQFSLSGKKLKEKLPKALNVKVNLDLKLNGELIGTSGIYTILCDR